MGRCPVCGQSLPKTFDDARLQRQLAKLTVKARARERQELETAFRERLRKRLEEERNQIRRSAEQEVHADLQDARRRADKAEAETLRETKRLRQQLEYDKQRAIQAAAKSAARESRADISRLESAHAKEMVKHEGERAKLLVQVEQLSRKLEKQSSDQLGAEAHFDLETELASVFKTDKIQPVRRGKRGADIVHHVMDGAKCIGRIVYESKNLLSWQNSWITKAKQYQTQYETSHVVIVSRTLPARKKGFCIVKNIPVVAPTMAASLASLIRDGIVEVARMRMDRVGSEEKAQRLYDYIRSDRFVTRFRGLAETVDTLRDHQQKEKDWHEGSWEKQSELLETLDSRRREIDAQLKTIFKRDTKPALLRMTAKAGAR
jgi:hypothetical protein